MDKWTIGADIEMMLEENGTLVSAVPLLPDNANAEELPHGTVFHDNVLAEFTVEPAEDADSFVRNITGNIKAMTTRFADVGIGLRVAASANYPQNQLECETSKRFGCEPDFDAYLLKVNRVADDADETTLRTAGGHIHFSHPIFSGDPMKIVQMIKLMDLHLGVPSIVLDTTSGAAERRKLYGKAGAHRPKDYPGGEYRSLSSFWAGDAESIRWAYQQTEKCLAYVLKNETVESLGFDEVEVCRIINEADVSAAKAMTERTA